MLAPRLVDADRLSHWEDHHHFSSTFYNDCKVKSYFQPFEGFMNDDVLDSGRRYESSRRA